MSVWVYLHVIPNIYKLRVKEFKISHKIKINWAKLWGKRRGGGVLCQSWTKRIRVFRQWVGQGWNYMSGVWAQWAFV